MKTQARYPSRKTIESRLGMNEAQSKAVRAAMERGTDLESLQIIDALLEGFGVESIGLPDGCYNNCQTPDVQIDYVNMGDPYKQTVMIVNGVYRVGCWGDVVERYGNA